LATPPANGAALLNCAGMWNAPDASIRLAYSEVIAGGTFNPRGMKDVTGGPAWLDTDRYDILAKLNTNCQSAGLNNLQGRGQPGHGCDNLTVSNFK
jgi:hypothetical protein